MGGRSETKVENTSNEYVRIEELSYEDTLRVTVGEAATLGLAPRTDPQRSQDEVDRNTPSSEAGRFIAKNLGALGGGAEGLGLLLAGDTKNLTTYHATLGLFGKSRWSTTTDIDDSGWQFVEDWFTTKWDRARYSVGIKELGIFSNEYDTGSEFVSVEYSVPGPIAKVALHVDMVVPRQFLDFDPLRAWIEFFVTFDEGKTWDPIAPVSNVPVADASGRRLPTIINVNSPLPPGERISVQGYVDTQEAVRSCRLRCRFTRPEAEEFERFTPILKGYRLKFTVRRSIL